jgi:predicted Zn-dependent peptidase
VTQTHHSDEAVSLTTFDNGLTVAQEVLPYLRSATAGLWIAAGSAHEKPHETGLAHFLEHLFFKGTKTRTVRQIMEAIESRGGQINAFTSREYTCLYVKTLDNHIQTGIEILADVAKNALFADLEKERNVVLEEIASVEDTPDEHIHDLLTEYLWPNHALGRPVSGTQESVSQLFREHVQTFYDTWYKPGRMVFSIAGNFDREAVLSQVRAEFDGLIPGAAPAAAEAPAFRGGVQTVDRDIAQAHVCLGFPAPDLRRPDRYVCDMVSNILGGGSTSRLFERIREDEGLAYSIYTFHSLYTRAGMLGVYAAVAPQSYQKTLDLTFEELRRLCAERISAEELEMNREQIKGNMLMALESTFTRMSRMAKCLMYYGRLIPVDEVIANVDAITPDDVQSFAQKTFTPENCALVTLGPTDGHAVESIPL